MNQEFIDEMLYVPLEGTLYYGSENTFNLEDAILKFIEEFTKKVFVIFGNAGSGKTFISRKIEKTMWLLYKSKGSIFPLYISLTSLDNPYERAIEESLTNLGFDE